MTSGADCPLSNNSTINYTRLKQKGHYQEHDVQCGTWVWASATCCYAFNLKLIFDLHHTELNETMGRAQGKQFRQQYAACL